MTTHTIYYRQIYLLLMLLIDLQKTSYSIDQRSLGNRQTNSIIMKTVFVFCNIIPYEIKIAYL